MIWYSLVSKENIVAERLSFDIRPIADQLAQLPDVDLKTDEMIAPYTSYKIGGPTAIWAARAMDGACEPKI